MTIDYALALYLHRYGNIPLLGLGNLSFQNESAKLSFPDRKIYPSVQNIMFSNNSLSEIHLLNWLSKELRIDPATASELYKDWVFRFQNQLKIRKNILWKGIGNLTFTDESGDLVIHKDKDYALQLSEGIHAERVIRSGNTHTLLVGEAEKSSVEMEEALQQKQRARRKGWPYLILLFFVLASVSIWLIIQYYPESWARKGNNIPIRLNETPVRNNWIP